MKPTSNGLCAGARHALLGTLVIGGGLPGSVASAGVNELTSLGPEGGRVADVEFHRGLPNVVYMAAAGGFYRSTDSGGSWQRTASATDRESAIDDIAVDPGNSERVYAATGTRILVSQDGGLTFNAVSLPGRQGGVWQVDCGADGVIYVPDGAKMYRSADHGRTWQVTGTFPLSYEQSYSTVAVDPTDARVVYASVFGRGVFVSRDAGASWQVLDSEPELYQTQAIEIDPANPQRLWAVTINGLFLSVNGGVSWTKPMNGIVDTVAVDPLDSMNVYAGPQWHSTNGGATWTQSSQPFGHSMGRSGVTLHPTEAGRLIAFSDGIWLSSDAGAHWTRSNAGLVATDVRRIVPSPTTSGFYLATSNGLHRLDGDGMVRALDNSQLVAMNPYYPAIQELVASPNGAVDTLFGIFGSLDLVRSFDGGSHWTVVAQPSGNPQPLSLAVSPGPQPTLFLGTAQGAFSSTDFGDTWTPRNVGLPMVTLIAASSDPQVLYASATADGWNAPAGLFRSTDGGQSWLASGVQQLVVGIAIHPTDPRIVIVGGATDLQRTTDGGATWERASADADTYYSIAFDPRSPSIVYAVSSSRVIRSTDGGRTWQRLAVAQTYFDSPLSVIADPSDENGVLVGTIGRGLQQLSIRPDVQVTVTGPGVATTNAVMAFTVRLENRSGVPARNARVTLQLPTSATNISATTAAGSCTVNGQQVVCAIDLLAGGVIASIALNTTTAIEGTFSVQAEGAALDADSNTANNSAAAQVSVSRPPKSGGGGGSASLLMLLALAALIIAAGALNKRGQTLA